MTELPNINDINNCFICNEKLTKSLFYNESNCESCHDFNIYFKDIGFILYFKGLISFGFDSEITAANFSLYDNNINYVDIKLEHTYEKNIYKHEFVSNTLYENRITLEEFQELNLKEFVFKIINNYKKNMLFL